MELMQSVAAMMAEEPFKLLIVDSITANLRVDFSGRGELAERQQRLGQMMSRLRKVPCACVHVAALVHDRHWLCCSVSTIGGMQFRDHTHCVTGGLHVLMP